MANSKLRMISFIAAGIGLLDSLYLSWVKLTNTQVYCAGSSSCETVGTSRFSEIAGIPIALLGAGAYLVILALLYLEKRGGFWRDNSPLLVFGISLAGTIYSAYLTYVEIAILRAICFYCVISAIVILVILAVSLLRMSSAQPETNLIRRGG